MGKYSDFLPCLCWHSKVSSRYTAGRKPYWPQAEGMVEIGYSLSPLNCPLPTLVCTMMSLPCLLASPSACSWCTIGFGLDLGWWSSLWLCTHYSHRPLYSGYDSHLVAGWGSPPCSLDLVSLHCTAIAHPGLLLSYTFNQLPSPDSIFHVSQEPRQVRVRNLFSH